MRRARSGEQVFYVKSIGMGLNGLLTSIAMPPWANLLLRRRNSSPNRKGLGQISSDPANLIGLDTVDGNSAKSADLTGFLNDGDEGETTLGRDGPF
ncbi:hypothetical protein E2562_027074 [Oryza meyeriana var. granulata]|uniref:Uncharacterized protein n=1 Tax=Oryza meyeriana var. granulata TaxID=110450 RepID=A0A6G1EZ81_9ORYZ|nr:hypothetical protein E2562_027074 [Oryza meyeriana var. granulata]